MGNNAISPSYDEARVKEIILQGRAAGLTWSDIDHRLNKENLLSPTGKPWRTGNSCNWAISQGWVARVKNTTAGAKGSTKRPQYSPLNGLAKPVKRTRPSKEKESISDQEIEEIMTSNLATPLKMKVVRIVALSR